MEKYVFYCPDSHIEYYLDIKDLEWSKYLKMIVIPSPGFASKPKDSEGRYILTYEADPLELNLLFEYLQEKDLGKMIKKYDAISIRNVLNFYIVKLSEYDSIVLEELIMRDRMYDLKYEHEYSDEHHGLIKLDEELWNKICHSDIKREDNYLFKDIKLQYSSWEDILENLEYTFENLFNTINNIFIAGGSVFCILFGKNIKDIDVFIYNSDEKQAIKKIKRIGYYTSSLRGMRDVPVTRTKNAITFSGYPYFKGRDLHYIELQFILRLYRTKSEIIHGFDVDSCCMGYDGKDIWLTKRCLHSLMKGYNTVNFEFLSPSYETRLVKYAMKGIAIKIPNFDRVYIKEEDMRIFHAQHFIGWYNSPRRDENYEVTIKDKFEDLGPHMRANAVDDMMETFKDLNLAMREEGEHIEEMRKEAEGDKDKYEHMKHIYIRYLVTDIYKYTNFGDGYKYVSRLKGVDKLLALEARYLYYPESKNYSDSIDKLNDEHSDYSAYSFSAIKIVNYLSEIIKYLKKSKDNPKYLEYSKKYMNIIPELYYKEIKEIKCNSFIRSKRLDYIRGDIYNVLNISDTFFELLDALNIEHFGQKITFKTTKPGEQMTNTFNQIVLEDNSIWYYQKFYSKKV